MKQTPKKIKKTAYKIIIVLFLFFVSSKIYAYSLPESLPQNVPFTQNGYTYTDYVAYKYDPSVDSCTNYQIAYYVSGSSWPRFIKESGTNKLRYDYGGDTTHPVIRVVAGLSGDFCVWGTPQAPSTGANALNFQSTAYGISDKILSATKNLLYTGTAYDFTTNYKNLGYVTTNQIVYNVTPYFPASCSDGIQNQDETDIDYGGICSTTTRIYHTAPLSNATTTSEHFDIKYEYYVNSATDPDLNKILVTICPRSYSIDNCTIITQNVTQQDDLYENIIDLTTSSGIQGLYHVDIALWNGVTTKTCAWYQLTCKPAVAVYGAQDFWEFNVVAESGTGDIPPVVDDNIFYKPPSPSACAIATFDGMDCLISVAEYIFKPSDSAFDNFKTLKDKIALKPPFGYISGIYDTLNELENNQAENVFILGSVTPINDLIFTPLRIGLSWLLYFAFAFALFKRFKDLQI